VNITQARSFADGKTPEVIAALRQLLNPLRANRQHPTGEHNPFFLTTKSKKSTKYLYFFDFFKFAINLHRYQISADCAINGG
jgi:hypothetical protein